MSLKNENIESRLENIEEILKMLLVNSVLGSSEIDKIQENILNSIRDRLIMFGMENLRLNYIEDKYYIFAENPIIVIHNLFINHADKIYKLFESVHIRIIPDSFINPKKF